MASESTNWVAIVGAVSGLSALFIWIVNSILRNIRKPKLTMSKEPYVGKWEIEDSNTGNKKTWNFVYFEVISRKGLALACEAKVVVVKSPEHVNLFQELTGEGVGIHWADKPYSGKSTGCERIDIGSTPQRLDVAFAVPNHNNESYLAMPIALTSVWAKPTCVLQAILPEGTYQFKVTVTCANGKGDSKKINFTSPNTWEKLNAIIA